MRQLDSFGCPFRKRKSIPDQKGVENNDTRRSIDIPNVEQKTHRSAASCHFPFPQCGSLTHLDAPLEKEKAFRIKKELRTTTQDARSTFQTSNKKLTVAVDVAQYTMKPHSSL
jgi:hypothetical protein